MVNKKCSVASCPGKPKDKLTYYCFPKNPRKNKEWVLACNRDDNFIPSQASRVCELHFQIDDFVPQKDPKSRRRLKDGKKLIRYTFCYKDVDYNTTILINKIFLILTIKVSFRT